MSKLTAIALPSGFKSIRVEDWGVGDLLVIEYNDGTIIALDALELGGPGERQACLYAPGAVENADAPAAGISWGGPEGVVSWGHEPDRSVRDIRDVRAQGGEPI